MIKISAVESSEDLRDCWEFVRNGMEQVLKRCPSNWIPEDVYHQVKTGQSILLIGECGKFGDLTSCMVLQKRHASDGIEFFIQAFYNCGNSDVYESFDLFLEFLKQHQARRIVMLSSRRGWDKLGEKLGFKAVYTQYELEL